MTATRPLTIADYVKPTCPLFCVDNAAEYYIGGITSDSGGVDVHDVPQCVPPFKEMWIEYQVVLNDGLLHRFASHIKTDKIQDEDRARLQGSFDLLSKRDQVIAAPQGMKPASFDIADTGWISQHRLYWEKPDKELIGISNPPLAWISNDGRLQGLQCDPSTHGASSTVVGVAVFACSLMHCKNVRHVESVPSGQRGKRRRGEAPSLRYYTLEIEAMKQVLRSEGKSETSGLKQALHICRGHFKDYRQSGLFGKLKGVFWWDSVVRGSATEGVVVKDYSVSP